MKKYRITNITGSEAVLFVSGLKNSLEQADAISLAPNEVKIIEISGSIFKKECCNVTIERIDLLGKVIEILDCCKD